MTSIHPHAHVHPAARLGEGTIVGPGAVVDEHVETGPGCEIRAHAILTGHTRIGARNIIGYAAVIGAEPQDLSYQGALSYTRIGDDNTIREHATIHRGTKEGSATEIGDRCFLMTGSHVGHNCRVGNDVILVNNVLLGGYVDVGDFAFLGGAVVVHQFTRIGAHSMTRGQTRLGMDVPPFCMAVDTNTLCGINRVGLKRRGFGADARKRILAAYDILFRTGRNRTQALAELARHPDANTAEIRAITDFAATTKRGLCTHREAADAGEDS